MIMQQKFDETVNEALVVKLGYDSIHTAIIDLKWKTTSSSEMSSIMAAMVPTTSFTPDPQIQFQVECHWQLL
jgi:hypothetical protein